MRNLLDISIVTYNSESYLHKLVESILGQIDMDLSTVRLVFHDNQSSDCCLEVLAELQAAFKDRFYGFDVYANPKNLGFGRAHNDMLSRGSAKFILILNPDIELTPRSLRTLLDTAENDENRVAGWEMRQAPYEHPKVYDADTLEVPWASCAALLVHRDKFAEINGFDPDFFLYGEDVDLSWRLQEKGWIIRYVPKAVVWHYAYKEAYEFKPAQFIGTTRANLFLRTRFGTEKAIIRGLKMQLSLLLLPKRYVIPRQPFHIMKTLIQFFTHVVKWRQSATRRIIRQFYSWDYCQSRSNPFFDTSDGVNLLFDKTPKVLPLVSIIIRTLGKQPLLAQALQCLANQTYPSIEVVVVEDGPSTLEAFLKDYPELNIAYYPTGKSMERCLGGNLGLSKAKGDYFLFLDEDDLLYADHIEHLVAALLKNNGRVAYSFSFERASLIDPTTDEVIKEAPFRISYDSPFSFIKLLKQNYLPINTVLFHRELIEQCGDLDPDLCGVEDWDLWVRFSLVTRPFICVPKTTAIFRTPLDQVELEKRREFHFNVSEKLRKKHAKLTVELNVTELIEHMEAITHANRRENVRINGAMPLLKQTLGVSFLCRSKRLDGIGLLIGTYERKNTGRIFLLLKDADHGGEVVRRCSVEARKLVNNDYVPFFFKPVHGCLGKRYYFELSYPGSSPLNTVAVYYSSAIAEDQMPFINGRTFPGAILFEELSRECPGS